MCQFRNYWKHYYDDQVGLSPNSISNDVVLKAGEKYYMEIYYMQDKAGGHFTVGVEMESDKYEFNS